MQFGYAVVPCLLMKTIDVLCYQVMHDAVVFKEREFLMRLIRSGIPYWRPSRVASCPVSLPAIVFSDEILVLDRRRTLPLGLMIPIGRYPRGLAASCARNDEHALVGVQEIG